MRGLGRTRPFRGPNGEVVLGSIAEVKYLPIGGLDQWVMVRGEDLANPLLVMLHGGPGFSETHFFRRFNAPLEKAFTVVYWDQRGAGKSFDPKTPRASMTVERFIADLDELVDAVCKRVSKDKVTLFGHSWGSVLGPLYATRHPERVAAYVGSGQIGDWAASETASYTWALGEAERRGNRKAVRALQTIGPPPHTAKALWTQRTWLNRLEGRMNPKVLWQFARMFMGTPERSLLELPSLFRGMSFSLAAMWEEVTRINLLTAVPSMEAPAFFFLGNKDHWVPPEISVAYFDVLDAPSKQIVWFEESGHEPFADEPAKFNESMIELVRPVAA